MRSVCGVKYASSRLLLGIICVSAVGSSFLACAGDASVLEVVLTPQVPQEEEGRSVRWSPKGERLFLLPADAGMSTNLQLGPEGTPPFLIHLEKGEGERYYSRLLIDHNHDGSFDDTEAIETIPDELRGRMWSSFDAEVDIPVVDPWSGSPETNPYALSFWYVDDPNVVAEEPALRFSRRGWMEGRITIDGVEAVVLLTESLMDGVYDMNDYWAMATSDSAANVLEYESARPVERHAWLLENAYSISEVDPSGRRLVLVPHDPGMTRADEAKMDDHLADDRNAARSGRMVNFQTDFVAAEALAQSEAKPLFVDFETVWCGPCHVMDEWVYTADSVVNAAASYVSVKVDGDDYPELTERFEVDAYPTMLVVSPDGSVLRRGTGYMSVVEMTEFLRGR